MSTNYYRAIITVGSEDVPHGFGDGEKFASDSDWPGDFISRNYDDESSFLTQSCGNWIKFAFQDLITSINLPDLNFFAKDEAVIHPNMAGIVLTAIEDLLKFLESEPIKIAHILGYSERDISCMQIPIEEYSFDANLDSPGVGIEYLLYYSIECQNFPRGKEKKYVCCEYESNLVNDIQSGGLRTPTKLIT